jgi:hypothetical protein
MLGVGLDGFHNEIQPVCAVDFAGDAVIVSRLDVAAGLGEVMQPVDSTGGIVTHHEHRESAVAALVAVKQDEVIGAEVEHTETSETSGKTEREPASGESQSDPAREAVPVCGSAVVELPGGLLRARDIVTARRLAREKR